MRVLAGLAAGAPIPVFAVSGVGAREAVQDLRLSPRLDLVDSPSAANVLLTAGVLPDALAEPLARIHDAISHPRCTIHWGHGGSAGPLTAWPFVHHVDGDVVATIARVHGDLLIGRQASDPPLLPDVDPAPWRGVGPYGQGGSGMTGGTPYGRPMAELAPDRDGLRLDALPLRVGPFVPPLPTGLVLELTFAGDMVLEAGVGENPFAGTGRPDALRPGLEPFVRALREPVPIAELELARAREHLRWIASALIAHGLPALALRALRLAQQVRPGDGEVVTRFARRVTWTQVLRWATAGVGRTEPRELGGLDLGPVSRAAGLADDARIDDPAYHSLGFEPIVGPDPDAAGRWRQRLAEAAQSLALAARAGDRRTEPTGRVESPRGGLEPGSAPTTRLLPLVPALIAGLEWGDAVVTIVSLDLDLEEAALVAPHVMSEEAA